MSKLKAAQRWINIGFILYNFIKWLNNTICTSISHYELCSLNFCTMIECQFWNQFKIIKDKINWAYTSFFIRNNYLSTLNKTSSTSKVIMAQLQLLWSQGISKLKTVQRCSHTCEALWDHWVGEALCPDSSSVEYVCRQSKQTRFIVSCRFVTYCTVLANMSTTVRQTTTNEYTFSAAFVPTFLYCLIDLNFNLNSSLRVHIFSLMLYSRESYVLC